MSVTNLNLPARRFENFEETLKYNEENGWPQVEPQEKLVVHKYVELSDPRKAAKECGISLQRLNLIMRDRLVQAYFSYVSEQMMDVSILNRAFIEQEYLTTLAQLNGDEDVPLADRDGNMVMTRHFNGPAKVSLLKDMRSFVGVKDSAKIAPTISINFGAAGYRPEHDATLTIEGETLVKD